MPAILAAPWLGTAIAGVAAGTGSIVAAKMASGANKDAAALQTTAINHGADLQAKSADDTLAFEKQKDAEAQAQFEAAQRANYNQYVSRARAAQALGDTIGFHLPDPAAYVSPTAGGGGPSGPSGAPASGGPAPAIDPSKGDVGQQISSYFKSRGVPDTETPYWVQKWGEFGQKDPAYFNSRLAQADIFGKGGSGSSAPGASPMSANAYVSRPISSFLPQAPSATPALSAPSGFRLRGINTFVRT